MILLIKYKGRCEEVAIQEATTLSDLEEQSKRIFGVENQTFCLSLNKQDPVGKPDAKLSELGLVEKDCLHLIEHGREGGESTSHGGGGAQSTLVALPSLRQIDILEETFEKAFKDGMPTCLMQNEMEVLSALVYVAFIAHRFRNKDGSVGIPSEWKDLSSARFFKFLLKHPVTDHIIKVTCTAPIITNVNAAAYVQVEELSDSKAPLHCLCIPLIEVPREMQRGTMTDAVKVFLGKVYNGIVKKVYGSLEPPYLAQLPSYPVLVITKYLPLKDFSNLSKTCKSLHSYWEDDFFWKEMFERDFGAAGHNDTDSANWKEKYKQRYLLNQQNHSEYNPFGADRSTPELIEANQFGLPRYEYPGIGGPSDLHPALDVPLRFPEIFPYPGGRSGQNVPSMRGPVPGVPRYNPPFPADPYARIYLPPPGRRGAGRNEVDSAIWREVYKQRYLHNRQRYSEYYPFGVGRSTPGLAETNEIGLPRYEYPGIGGPSDLHSVLDVPFSISEIYPSPGGRSEQNVPSMIELVQPPFPSNPYVRRCLPLFRSRRVYPYIYFPPFL
uniref:F-box domain-containing protein n=1 Tax=Trichuris muris TaxID=70415 RepID=A0A5S6R4R2_TRIMR